MQEKLSIIHKTSHYIFLQISLFPITLLFQNYYRRVYSRQPTNLLSLYFSMSLSVGRKEIIRDLQRAGIHMSKKISSLDLLHALLYQRSIILVMHWVFLFSFLFKIMSVEKKADLALLLVIIFVFLSSCVLYDNYFSIHLFMSFLRC